MTERPRLFRLERDVDSTGVSGAGHVADGVVWADGTATLRWFGAHASTANWDRRRAVDRGIPARPGRRRRSPNRTNRRPT